MNESINPNVRSAINAVDRWRELRSDIERITNKLKALDCSYSPKTYKRMLENGLQDCLNELAALEESMPCNEPSTTEPPKEAAIMQLTNRQARELILKSLDRYIDAHDRVSAGAANLSEETEDREELLLLLQKALPDPPRKKVKKKATKKARKR